MGFCGELSEMSVFFFFQSSSGFFFMGVEIFGKKLTKEAIFLSRFCDMRLEVGNFY